MNNDINFWNSLITEKSWNILQDLKKLPVKFIVIGGWAAWLWSKRQKSKDIDIVLLNLSDIDYLKKNYDLRKNDMLKKYEIKIGGIDVDIYVPYFSELAMPVEDIRNYAAKIEGFDVPTPEALLMLKQMAELERKDSTKGEKDRIDIMSMLDKVDFNKYNQLALKYKKDNFAARLKTILNSFREFDRLGMNPRELKLFKKAILEKMSKAGL